MPDLSPLATSVGELLKQRGDTIAITESSCGGLISAPGFHSWSVGLFSGRSRLLHPGGSQSIVGSARQRH